MRGNILRNIKKLLCLMLVACTLVSQPMTNASATTRTTYDLYFNDAIFRLSSLNIIPETFNDEQIYGFVKRKEFAKYLISLISYDDIVGTDTDVFSDVDDDEYMNYINLVSELGYMCGDGTGNFYPDDFITYEQAIKVLVECLGYYPAAQQQGGYPNGHIQIASKLKVSEHITSNYKNHITLHDLTILMNNALDVDLLVQSYTPNPKVFQIEEGSTLFDLRLDVLDLVYGEGIVEANEHTSVFGSNISPESSVYINNEQFNIGETNADELLGYKVNFYAENEQNYTLKSLQIDRDNSIIEIDADDVSAVNNYTVKYCDDSEKEETVELKRDFEIIYNGKFMDNSSSIVNVPEYGRLLFLDNDSDGYCEYVFINEAFFIEVSRTNLDYNRIYFKKGNLHNSSYIELDEDMKKCNYKLMFQSGEETSIESIKENDVLMIFPSKDNTILKIYIIDEAIAGTISEISDDYYIINGCEYRKLETEELAKHVKLGTSGYFYVAEDVIVKYQEYDAEENGSKYALVHAIGISGSLNKKVEFRLIYGCNYKIIEEDTDDDKMIDTRYMKVSNINESVIELADYVRLNGNRVSKSDVQGYITPPYTVIKYSLNDEGKINRIDIAQQNKSVDKRTLNTSANLFGATIGGTFAYDENTVIFALPKESMETFDEMRYFTPCKLENKQQYEVVGFDVDPDTKLAKAALVITTPDTVMGAVNDSTKISIVRKIINVRDEDGNFIPKIYGYTGNEKFEKLTSDLALDVALTLSPGDLIYYSVDYEDKINDIQIFKRIDDLSDFYSRKGSIEEYYGIAEKVVNNDVSPYALDLVDSVVLNVSDSDLYPIIETVSVSKTIAPPIYLYDKKYNVLGATTAEDIQSIESSGYEDASKVYVYKKESVVKVVLIVND